MLKLALIHTSSYELVRPLPNRKNKKIIALMEDILGGKIINKICKIHKNTQKKIS